MEEKLFGNVGRKIQIAAIVLFGLLIIGGVIAWLYFICNTYESVGYYGYERVRKPLKADDWIGWVCLVSGVLSLLPCWILYGFGELLKNTEMSAAFSRRILRIQEAEEKRKSDVT